MLQAETIERLTHVSPNTPDNGTRPFRDQRFSMMWCPFHEGRLVGLLVYVTDWGEVWFNCEEGCSYVQQRIEGILTKKQRVTSYVTANGSTIVYEARWSLGACDE